MKAIKFEAQETCRYFDHYYCDKEDAQGTYYPAAEVDALVEAAKEVARISDRKHDAWDKLKAALKPFVEDKC